MIELFWAAMHSLSSSTAQVLSSAYDFGAHRNLLDLGGGSGAFPLELCAGHSGLRATVFDLPHEKLFGIGIRDLVARRRLAGCTRSPL